MPEIAGHLPGLSSEAVAWRTLTFGTGNEALEVAVPALDDTQIAALAAHVRQARSSYLKSLPTAQIVATIDRAISRLLDRTDPWRRKMEALLPRVTGYDAEMVRLGLTGYLKTFRAPELHRFIAEDFANPQMLDGFQPVVKGGVAKAVGPELMVHIWAGNVPGLPLWSLISGLLAKAGNIGKVASAEPLFAGWFAKLLGEIDPRLADCLAIVWWKGGDEAPERAMLAEADLVLAYGATRSLEQIRGRLPATTRFLGFGHKISFGMIARQALDPSKVWATAHRAAFDVVRYDQQGCYSPQAFFVERGGRVSPSEFSNYLAHELAAFERKFPRRRLSFEEAGGVAAWRNAEEAKTLAASDRQLLGDAAGAWSVVHVEAPEGLAPSGLNRTVRVVVVDSLEDAVPRVAPFRAFLQTVGIAAPPEAIYRIGALLGDAGATRICALGDMTAPEAGWHHDGRFNLLDLVTMVEIDRSAEIAAEALAPYAD